MTYFISGHREITQEEFDRLYKVEILKVLLEDPLSKFVVGDYHGVDEMAQKFLAETINDPTRVTVYHMFSSPRVYIDERFNKEGGFLGDEERDAAMTKNSDRDIAFVRPGKRKSGTAQNIIRRIELMWDK